MYNRSVDVLLFVAATHSADNMLKDVQDSLKRFDLPTPFAATTDNASAAANLATELVDAANRDDKVDSDTYVASRAVGCAAHTLQLSVRATVELLVQQPLLALSDGVAASGSCDFALSQAGLNVPSLASADAGAEDVSKAERAPVAGLPARMPSVVVVTPLAGCSDALGLYVSHAQPHHATAA
jgi:hypothetical protein